MQRPKNKNLNGAFHQFLEGQFTGHHLGHKVGCHWARSPIFVQSVMAGAGLGSGVYTAGTVDRKQFL